MDTGIAVRLELLSDDRCHTSRVTVLTQALVAGLARHLVTNNHRRYAMSEQSRLKPLAIALGATFASALAIGSATAAENPFGQSELSGGYKLAENTADKPKMEGQCGEGKCGAMTKTPKEGQCGAQNKTMKEGQCGGMNKPPMEGQCGAMGKAQKEGDKAATPETPDNAVKPE